MQSKPHLMTYSGYLKSLRPQKRQVRSRKYPDDMAQAIMDEARLRGMPLPPQPTTEAAEQAASSQPESIMPEHDHNQNTETTLQTASVQNNIEYDGTNQEQTPAAHYESDFKHYRLYDPTTNIQYSRKTPSRNSGRFG